MTKIKPSHSVFDIFYYGFNCTAPSQKFNKKKKKKEASKQNELFPVQDLEFIKSEKYIKMYFMLKCTR